MNFCRTEQPSRNQNVGRTPPSAPDPLVRLFLRPSRPTGGSAAGQGARPTKSSHAAKESRSCNTGVRMLTHGGSAEAHSQ
jgi:hypothetical protein